MRLSPIMMGLFLLGIGALGVSARADRSRHHSMPSLMTCYKGQESRSLGHRIKEDTRDSTDGLIITPRVKKSILEDSQLNNRHNLINVNTKDYVVHLVGHVSSRALKERAGHIAAAKLAKIHKNNYRVSNELSVGR